MPRSSSILRGSDGLPLSLLGIVSLAAIPLSLGAAAYFAWPLRAILSKPKTSVVPAAGVDNPTSPTQIDPAVQFANAMDAHLAQINGRSMFFIPPEPKPQDAPKGPVPEVYGGPALIAVVNDTAWFADGQRLSIAADQVATTKGSTSPDLKLIKLTPPWTIRVSWQGGEFDLDLYKRTGLDALTKQLGDAANVSVLTPPQPAPGGSPPKLSGSLSPDAARQQAESDAAAANAAHSATPPAPATEPTQTAPAPAPATPAPAPPPPAAEPSGGENGIRVSLSFIVHRPSAVEHQPAESTLRPLVSAVPVLGLEIA